jgi:diaminopropionate ammonia-lyase
MEIRMIALRASVGDTLHLLARRSTVRGMNVFVNPTPGVPGIVVLPSGGFRRAKAAITAWEGYAPTPLHQIMRGVWLKDEGPRFGLCSFKALGGGYAVEKLAAGQQGKITVTCATDGNHGRAVAWGAQRAGCRCIIFVHATVSQGRIDAIARYGAEVRVVPGTYDDAVRAAAVEAEKAGWTVVSDTSYPGYTEIPRDVMQGYRLMADEAADQWAGPPPTHVFMQAGGGGAAAGCSWRRT